MKICENKFKDIFYLILPTLKSLQHFAYGLFYVYEIKRICHRVQYFIILYGRFQHLTNFLNITKFLDIKLQ